MKITTTLFTLWMIYNAYYKTVFCYKFVDGYWSDRFWIAFDMKLWTFYINANESTTTEFHEIFVKRSECTKGLISEHEKAFNFLPIKIYQKFPNLVAYSVYNSSIKAIRYENFENLKKLQYINFGYNQISHIPADSFKDLTALKFLLLLKNHLQSIDERIFRNIVNLRNLRLDDNQISSVLPNAFNNMKELQNITLSGNSLKSLSKDQFKNNNKLEHVWLNNNEIISLSSTIFDGQENLILINLKNNKCITGSFCDKFYICSEKLSELKNEIASNCGL